jgi:hypothetical protein
MRCKKPNHFRAPSRWVSILAAFAVLLFSISVFADNQRVLVDIGPIDNDLSREAQIRLSAELKAAGFELTTEENLADVRATLVARDGRLVVYLELPNGASAVIRADDVQESGAPEVLSVRAVERIRAEFALAANSPPPIAKPPLETKTIPAQPRQLLPISPPISVFPRHVLLGGVVSLDGGAFSFAPTIAVGTGLGRFSFLRGSFWGPTTNTTVQSPAGRATVWSLGGRFDAGFAFSARPGTILGAGAGLGLGRYAIEGQTSPGFKPRSAGQIVFLGGADAFWLQALTRRLYLELDVGISIALPSVVIRIDQRNAAERGFPEIHGRFGIAVAF